MGGKEKDDLTGRALERFVAGEMSPAEAARWAETLSGDRTARRDLFARLDVELALEQVRRSGFQTYSLRGPLPIRPSRSFWSIGGSAGAAAALIVGALFFLTREPRPPRMHTLDEMQLSPVTTFGDCRIEAVGRGAQIRSGPFAVCEYRSARKPELALQLRADGRLVILRSSRGWRVVLEEGHVIVGAERSRADEVVELVAGGLFVSFRGTSVELAAPRGRPATVRVLRGEVAVAAVSPESRRALTEQPPGSDVPPESIPGNHSAELTKEGPLVLTPGQGARSVESRAERIAPVQPVQLVERVREVERVQAGRPTAPGRGPGGSAVVGIEVQLTLRDGRVLRGFVREVDGRYRGVSRKGEPVDVAVHQVLQVDVLGPR